MSGKFMNVKKIVIPTITMVVIASQLMGCVAASQDELLTMLNQGDAIEIEVAVPENIEQGETQSNIPWEELASISSNSVMRKDWDDTLGITNTDTGKNGVLYVNASGENDNNNTLHVALHNREFLKLLEDEAVIEKLATAVQNNYADIDVEDEMKAVYMGINGYFNLLPDNTPNYSNPDSTLTRAEFMTMVMRATTPVAEITADASFTTAVGENELNIYAQEVVGNSYLGLADKSLNNLTYNGTITRAEALYMLTNMIYKDATPGSTTLVDAKDGGDIASKQKFKDGDTAKDYCKSYELTYAIQNPDGGLPTPLYNALVVAYEKEIITDTETRWDEGLTKAEAVAFIIEALKNDPSIELFNANNGTATVDITDYVDKVAEMTREGNVALGTDQTLTDEILIVDEAYEQTEEAGAAEFTVTPMDATMYAVKDCNVRKGPDAETYERAGTLNQAQEVKVTGKVNEANWYEISLSDGTTAYVSGTLISEKPQPKKIAENGAPINPETGQPYKPGDVIGTVKYNDGGTATGIYGGSI